MRDREPGHIGRRLPAAPFPTVPKKKLTERNAAAFPLLAKRTARLSRYSSLMAISCSR